MDNENNYQEQMAEVTTETQFGCKVCGNPEIEQNHKLELCKACREQLYKRPFPRFIKIAFVIIAAILLVALVRFPSALKAGIALERGIQAEKEGKYTTAVNEYKEVTERFPDSTLALGRLLIATYNNSQVYEADQLFRKIAGRKSDSNELADEVNSVVKRLDSIYYISDEFNKIVKGNENTDPKQSIVVYKKYLQKNPNDVQAAYYYSNTLFDMGNFDEAKKVMKKVLDSNPDFYEGQLFMAAICREKGQFEEAEECCNLVIRHNSEYSYAYSSLAKVELKNHNDKKGLEMAQKAYQLNTESSNIVATLAIAYHYNNMISKRDDTLKKFKQFKDNNTYDLKLMDGIFSGKNKWRK